MLRNYVTKSSIIINPHALDKETLFTLMAKKAHEQGLITSVKDMVEKVMEKEALGVTELIPHVVLPHSRGDFAKKLFVMFAISKDGFAYKGAKKNMVNLAIVIGVPSSNRDYLKLLASISRLISKEDFLKEILNANVPEDVVFTLKDFSKIEQAEEDEVVKKQLVILTINKDVDSHSIAPLLAEVGIGLPTEIEGNNLSNVGGLFSFLSPFSHINGMSKYTKIYYGITTESDAALRLNSLLKDEDINLNENGTGSLLHIELAKSFGGYGEDVNF